MPSANPDLYCVATSYECKYVGLSPLQKHLLAVWSLGQLFIVSVPGLPCMYNENNEGTYLYQFPIAAVTNYNKLSFKQHTYYLTVKTTRMYYLTFLEVRNLKWISLD